MKYGCWLKDVTFHDWTPYGLFPGYADTAPEVIVQACLFAKNIKFN